MSKRLLLAGLVCLALGPRALADSLDAQLFPLTGEIRFHNPSGTDVPFVYYSIRSVTSHSGALNPSSLVWQSISDNYDASGNGFIDPTNQWSKLLPPDPTKQLAEGVFFDPGGSLAAYRSVSFGRVWNTNIVPWTDIAFDVQGAQPVTVNIQRALDGDYDHSNTVDMADYAVWRLNFGSTTALNADGNINGMVDAADYDVWRMNFGTSLPGAGAGQSLVSVGGTVPEPATGGLVLMAVVAIISGARPRRVA